MVGGRRGGFSRIRANPFRERARMFYSFFGLPVLAQSATVRGKMYGRTTHTRLEREIHDKKETMYSRETKFGVLCHSVE